MKRTQRSSSQSTRRILLGDCVMPGSVDMHGAREGEARVRFWGRCGEREVEVEVEERLEVKVGGWVGR